MVYFFDFSKDNNDYRQRIAVVFRALFEKDFLENFYTVLEELFNGNYSILALKKVVEKNKLYLIREKNGKNPLIRKEENNSSVFIDSILKTIALMFLLEEVFAQIKTDVKDKEYRVKLEEELVILSDTIMTIESQRIMYLSKFRKNKLINKNSNKIELQLTELDDIFIKECQDIKLTMEEFMNTKDFQKDNIMDLCGGIMDTIASILRGRELEQKFLGSTSIKIDRIQ